MENQKAFSDRDWHLLQLRWEPIVEGDVRSVAIRHGDNHLLPIDQANWLVDHCWETIARYCLDQGFAYAKLCAQENGKAITFRVPAEFARSRSLITPSITAPSIEQWLTFPDTRITAIRFIPFYLGTNQRLQALEVGHYQGIPCYKYEDLQIVYCWDGFAVAIQQEQSIYRDVVQFLLHRRQQHMAILRPESATSQQLLELQDEAVEHPLIRVLPRALSYVMSIHAFNNADGKIAEPSIRLLAEPSILGICDSPSRELSQGSVYRLVEPNTVWSVPIEIQKSRTANFYSTWANVVAEIRKENGDLKRLIQQEIYLQKLWYKLFLLSECLECMATLDELALTLVQKLVVETQKEFLNFIRANPTASSLTNALKEDLVKTSKIRSVYETFVQQSALLKAEKTQRRSSRAL